MDSTILIKNLDTRLIIESVIGDCCPACGYAKARNGAFCFICYAELDERQKVSLRTRMGEGYQEAFVAALESMGKVAAIIPERTQV